MTTIRRQYNLPNCTLIVEGLSDLAASDAIGADNRQLISILVNVECNFPGLQKSLTGGREFFESLVTAVSDYTQEFLSGVPHSRPNQDKPALVSLEKTESKNLHRLIVESTAILATGQSSSVSIAQRTSAGNSTATISPAQTEINLTTVELFDLVEAIDQFLASSTLPNLVVDLTPVSKRYAITHEPLVKRAAPVALGVGGLTVAAIAFFMIPVPQVQKPTDPLPEKQTDTATPNSAQSPVPPPLSPEASPTNSLTPEPTTSPTSEPTNSLTPEPTTSPTSEPTTSPTPEPTTSPQSSLPQNSQLQSLVQSGTEINDPTQLRFLQRKIYDKIGEKLTKNRRFNNNLIYRVSVGKDGAIVGYKPVNSAARDRAQETPLPQLLYLPTNTSTTNKEPLAQYKVVFTKQGILQISPWNGYSSKPSLGTVITDDNQVQSLSQQLSEKVTKDWKGIPNYKRNLVYRVAVNKDGVIMDYEADNQAAYDYAKETPLPSLIQASNSIDVITKEPLAQFQVVFKPTGDIEVNRFRGYK